MDKIALVGDYPPPHGGIAIHVQQLQAFLRARQLRAQVLDIGQGRNQGDCVQGCAPAQMLAQVRRLMVDDWVVHLHTSGNNRRSWLLAMAVGLSAAKRNSVVTLHSGLLPAFLRQSTLHPPLASTALARFGQVVVVSEAQRRALVGAGVSDRKVRTVPPFLASQLCVGMPPQGFEGIRARRSPLLVMAHHPSPVYGRRIMFQALSRLRPRFPDIGLALFGPELDGPALEHEAREAGVWGLVDRLGEVDHPSALAMIRAADVFIRPTTADGDAVSVREALSLGVRCVASDAAPRPQGTYLFSTGNSLALAEAVAAALLDAPRAFEMPDAGPVLLEVYASLSGGPGIR